MEVTFGITQLILAVLVLGISIAWSGLKSRAWIYPLIVCFFSVVGLVFNKYSSAASILLVELVFLYSASCLQVRSLLTPTLCGPLLVVAGKLAPVVSVVLLLISFSGKATAWVSGSLDYKFSVHFRFRIAALSLCALYGSNWVYGVPVLLLGVWGLSTFLKDTRRRRWQSSYFYGS